VKKLSKKDDNQAASQAASGAASEAAASATTAIKGSVNGGDLGAQRKGYSFDNKTTNKADYIFDN